MAVVLLAGIYYIPPVHDRLAWRVEDLRTGLKYYFNPPSQAIFLPTQQAAIEAIVSATMQAHATAEAASKTPRVVSTITRETSIPTATPTPPPQVVKLPGVVYVDQSGGYNLCAPANLTMALKFWGWKGSRDDVIRVVKPGENNPAEGDVERGKADLNVMPYELVDFVNDHTPYRALYRYGGDIELIQVLVSNGFPIVAETGIYEIDVLNKISWMGHYEFITGYDETKRSLLVQDTYKKGANYYLPYDEFVESWLSFNRVFYVVYPADRESDVMSLLGSYADAGSAAKLALGYAENEIKSSAGVPLFFAWFARGTNHVALQEYVDAASAYDQAFLIYGSLDPNYSVRPWRMMWYQTGPYFAYYYSGRFQDVIDLADYTLNEVSGRPTLEESLYWRGLAEYALGDTAAAIHDVRMSVYYNKNFKAGIAKLQEWGVGP